MPQLNSFTTRNWRTIGIIVLLISAFFVVDLIPDDSVPKVLVSENDYSKISSQTTPTIGPISIEIVLSDENPSFTLTQDNADSIAIHFSKFILPQGDYLTLENGNGDVFYTYQNDDEIFEEDNSGWSDMVFSDIVIIKLHNESGVSYEGNLDFGIIADSYQYLSSTSLEESDFIFESIVGIDDKRDAICYSGSDPTKYADSQAVAFLWNTGEGYVCTAWRVGPDGHVFTNEHCITNSTQLSTTRLYFPWQKTTCDGGTWASDTIVYPGEMTFIQDSSTYDYALIHIADTSAIDSYGYLWLDVRTPIEDEEIYIPQHPGGRDKELAIDDTQNGSGLCRIDHVTYVGTRSGYTCDTEGGSSGSPVIASSSRKAIALHNTTHSGVMNMGNKFVEFFSEVDDYLRPRTIQSLTSPSSVIYDTTPEYVFPDENMGDDFRLWVSHNHEGVIFNEWVTRSGNCSGGVCTYTPAVTHPHGEYSVQFQTRNDAGTSDWSSMFTYTLGEIPATPTITGPIGTENFIRPTYSWTKVDYAEEYRVFVSHASVGTMFNDWVNASGICGASSCDWQSNYHLRTGNHSWWVMARNGVGSSSWSSPEVFKVWNTTPPTGSVTKGFPASDDSFTFDEFTFVWTENTRASWYKVYMTDSVGKLYNQYHRAADICYGLSCFLTHGTYSPLIHAPRGLSDLPTEAWIHWNVMPVNVAGNGDWTGYTKFWMFTP